MENNKKQINPFWLFVIGAAVGGAICALVRYIMEHKDILLSYIDGEHDECCCGKCGCEGHDDEESWDKDIDDEISDKYGEASSDLSDMVDEINDDSDCC